MTAITKWLHTGLDFGSSSEDIESDTMVGKEYGMKAPPRAPSRQPSNICKVSRQLSVSVTGNSDSSWNTTVAAEDEDITVTPCGSGLDRQVTGSTQDVSVDSCRSCSISVSSVSHDEGNAMFNRLKNHRGTFNPAHARDAKDDDEDQRDTLRLSNLSSHIHLSDGSSRNRKVDSLLMSPRRHDSPSVSSASSTSTGSKNHPQRRTRGSSRCSKNVHHNFKNYAIAHGFHQVNMSSFPDPFEDSRRGDLHLDMSHGTITTCPSSHFASPITPRVVVMPPLSSGSSDEEKNVQEEEEELVEALAKWEDSIEWTDYDPYNKDDDNDSISSLEVSLAGSEVDVDVDDDDHSSRRRKFLSEHVNDSTATNFDVDFLDENDYGIMTDDDAAGIATQRFQPAATHHVVRGSSGTSTKNCDSPGGTSSCSIGDEQQEDEVPSKTIPRVSLTRRDSLPRLPSSSLEVKESRWMADSSHGAASSIACCSTRTSGSGGGGSVDVPPTPTPKRGASEGCSSSISHLKGTIDWKLCFPSPIISCKDFPPPSPRRGRFRVGDSCDDDYGIAEKSQKAPTILPPGASGKPTAKPVPSLMPRWSSASNSLPPHELLENAIRTAKQWEVLNEEKRHLQEESTTCYVQHATSSSSNIYGRRWSST